MLLQYRHQGKRFKDRGTHIANWFGVVALQLPYLDPPYPQTRLKIRILAFGPLNFVNNTPSTKMHWLQNFQSELNRLDAIIQRCLRRMCRVTTTGTLISQLNEAGPTYAR
ncbi:unnamed protein product [Schistosoma curassoni]|uniref:UBC core domain-containing protein n=1 Tax=Schistosoma curassoni TaxID=6186 RepID=A0A183KZL2_9TREM|nr:unnamed protein product [Schistosoma curassoni]